MNHKLLILVLLLMVSRQGLGIKPKQMNAPVAKKINKELSIHGHTRIDPYYWLNERENPEVISYLTQENEYLEQEMCDYSDFREALFSEIIGRIKQTDESVPYKYNGYFYINRFEEGQEYPIYSRKKESLENPEIILLNVNEMAQGYDYYQVGGISIARNNELMAFGVDTVSRRLYTLYIKDLKTGAILPDVIPNTAGSAAWAADNQTLFYTLKDTETLRSYKIMRHKLGTDIADDVCVFEETDSTFSCYVYRTKSEKYIMIGSGSTLSTEYRFVDATTPEQPFTILEPRKSDHEYSVDHFDDHFYVVTNWNAKNFRLMVAPVTAPNRENWTELIAHRPDVLLEDIEIFRKYLVVSERKNGLTHIRIIDWKSRDEHYLDFGEEDYSAGISINPDYDSEWLRYGYTSLTTPSSTFDYNLTTRQRVLLKEQPVVGDFDKTRYESKRLYAPARDGEMVPVSIVYRKGLVLNGKNPLLLYGYGSYGHNVDPYFSSPRLSLLDRGFVFAIAHIRGSETLGRQWYDDGRMLNKKNTFTDFVDCAEYLIAQKYTDAEHLFAKGGSAGGLLMGAVANMRPDLFKGMVADVPFVDVVTTMLDESIPLTTGEYDEWGNPNNKTYYDYMLSYSPYDNVKPQAYPNMLVTTGLHDSQVQYWEPAKWVAKLRDMKTDQHVLLLYTNMDAGHGGASGRFEAYKEVALEYAFLFKLLGIKK